MSGIGRIPSDSGPITGPQSANPAILLFQFRRSQSQWYQTLYQSNPADPLADSADYIWQICHDMREWAETLPETLPIGIRELFDLELKYSYIYCIAPSGRAPHMTAYGRMLIFEYAISYIDRIFELAYGTVNPAFYSYHDALRVFFIGSQFIAVLRDATDALLARTSVPVPLSPPGKAPPPPMPPRSSGDNLDRSIQCLERVSGTLQKYGERWDNASELATSFEIISREVMDMLNAKAGMRDAAQQQMQFHQSQSPALSLGQARMHQSPSSQLMQPQQTEVKWIDMDVEQIMKGIGS